MVVRAPFGTHLGCTFVPVRVLLADNDPVWLDLVGLDLELEGHDVVDRVRSGDEALDRLAEFAGSDRDVDVLVVDHRMPPGMTGLEVVREAHRRWPRLRSILFTNYVDRSLAGRVEAAGGVLVPKDSLRALRDAISPRRPSPAR